MVIVLSPETQARAERIPDFAHRLECFILPAFKLSVFHQANGRVKRLPRDPNRAQQ